MIRKVFINMFKRKKKPLQLELLLKIFISLIEKGPNLLAKRLTLGKPARLISILEKFALMSKDKDRGKSIKLYGSPDYENDAS